MSYTIEYNQAIFFIEKENKTKEYFLFIRHGDNNVYDTFTNLRAKSWHYVKSGNINDIWKVVGYHGGVCEGGGLQRAKGWNKTAWITIEDYIALYRSKLKNSKPLKTFLNKFEIKAYVYVKDEHLASDENTKAIEKIKDFTDRYNMRNVGTYYYDKDKKEYVYTIQNYEELTDFLINYPRNYNKDFISGFRIRKFRRGH